MRLWSIHPKYLDRQGLTALWREGLGAIVSLNPSRGYHNHPQLERFKVLDNPQHHLAVYLSHVYDEATNRGYNYDVSKILPYMDNTESVQISVTIGQVEYEMTHLYNKMKERSIPQFSSTISSNVVLLNPMFNLIEGGIENWERL